MIADVSVPGRGTTIRAKISSAIPPQFDALSQSARVRLEAANPGSVLRPEMLVDMHVPIALPPAIAVPIDAVLDSESRMRHAPDAAASPR